MIRAFAVLICLTACAELYAQNIGINTSGAAAGSSALLDLNTGNTFTNPNGKGLLVPNVALTATNSANPVTSPALSLLVYNTATAGSAPNNVVPGFYYWDGAQWVAFGGTGSTNWALLGNSGTVDGTNFIGTTDSKQFNIRVANQKAGRIDHVGNNNFFGYQAGQAIGAGTTNTAIGSVALYSNTTGSGNTATGDAALYTNISGGNNVATGQQALYLNTGNNNNAHGFAALYNNAGGTQNTAMGSYALYNNIAGSNGTAVGFNSMLYANSQAGAFTNSNTALGFEALRGSVTAASNTGNSNTALGYQTLLGNTSGDFNTASGWSALLTNTTGTQNTATGANALHDNTIGSRNTALGTNVLYANTTGSWNSGVGYHSLRLNTIGFSNTALGDSTLYNNTEASQNVAVGNQALYTQSFANAGAAWTSGNVAVGMKALYTTNPTTTASGIKNTAIGFQAGFANTTGFNNTFIGNLTGGTATLSNVTAIGSHAFVTASNSIVLGSVNGTNGATTSVNVGIGTTAPGAVLEVAGGTRTNATVDSRMLTVTGNFNGAGDGPGGVGSYATFTPSANITIAYGMAVVGNANLAAGRTLTDLNIGHFRFDSQAASTGTLSNANILHVATPVMSGAKPTTITGLRVKNQGVAGVTTNYGIFVETPSGAASNYAAVFQGGNVGIGITAPRQALDMNGGLVWMEAVTAPTLLNSWVNFGSGFSVAGYWKDAMGMVHLQGLIANGTLGAIAFTLPAGYLPADGLRHLFSTHNTGVEGRIDIDAAGNVIIVSGGTGYVTLDGIMFRAGQ